MEVSFERWMQDVQARMEEALDGFLPSASTVPTALHEAMRHAVLDGGKRIRPLLCFAAGELVDAPACHVLRAAAAVEMIHAYSLVHDDMPCMDNDLLRRGKPTVHARYGEATALLVGDALQAQAFALLAGGDLPAERRVVMVKALAQASGSLGMCGGQAIDLDSVGIAIDREELEHMHRLKTGALLRVAVLLGAQCGERGPSADQLAALDAYAAAVGLAFQVVDDVLDATADSATLGKTAGKDAQDNKPTYVSLLGLERSRELAAKLKNDAEAALAPWGEGARRLSQLADLVVHRKA